MTLAPAVSVRLGNEVYAAQVARVTATLAALPAVSSFECALPAETSPSAAPGDDASLELDGGEGSSTVLTGTLRAIRTGLRERRYVASDGGAALAALRPASTYERRNARDIVRSLAGDATVDVGRVDLDVGLAAYVADQGRTAAEHVAYLAALGGASAGFDADGALTVAAAPTAGTRPDAALRYGRELLAYDVRATPPPDVRRVAVGSGPAGSAEAPEALRQSLDPLAGGEPQPGMDAVWTPTAVLRTPGAAGTASRAANDRAAAEATTLRARCILLPALRPGTVIEVQDLPDGLSSGPWTLTRVLHRLDAGRGGSTTLEARSAGGGGLLGAIGGLL